MRDHPDAAIAHFTFCSNDNMQLISFAPQFDWRQPPNLGSVNGLMHYVAKIVSHDKLPPASSDSALRTSLTGSAVSTFIRISH
jgi:hypothetical protein